MLMLNPYHQHAPGMASKDDIGNETSELRSNLTKAAN